MGGTILRVLGWIVLLGFLAAFCVGMGALAKLHDRFLPLDFTPPASEGPETWAVVGLDDRQFVDNPLDWDNTEGARTDVVILLTKTSGGYRATSISRDTMVPLPSGGQDRLTIAWLHSPQDFVDSMCRGFGVPVDHIIRFDFRSFATAVDAVGGIPVTTPYALRQDIVGSPGVPWISLPAGTSVIDGETALRFVRTRTGMAYINGAWVPEPNAAQARQARAAQVFAAVLAKAKRNPARLAKVAWRVAPDVGIDRGLTYSALVPLASVGSKVDVLPETYQNDVVVHTTDDTKRYISNLGYTGCHV